MSDAVRGFVSEPDKTRSATGCKCDALLRGELESQGRRGAYPGARACNERLALTTVRLAMHHSAALSCLVPEYPCDVCHGECLRAACKAKAICGVMGIAPRSNTIRFGAAAFRSRWTPWIVDLGILISL